MTYMICELVEVEVEVSPATPDDAGNVITPAITKKEFVQREREATQEEAAEIEARKLAAVPTVDGARSVKLALINAECDKRMSALVAGYPEREQQTFPKQEQEARAFTADATAVTPMLDELALNRGIDKASLASRIIAKADAFAAFSGKMIGYRQKLEDQINTASTVADLEVIDPLSGWPV